VLVTGAAGDIGSAMALRLAGEGADVTLVDVRPEAAVAELLARFEPLPGTARYVRADVTDADALGAALRGVPTLDVAIGNAGIVRSSPFLEVTLEDWRAHLDVNLTGAFLLTQAAARLMVERGHPGLVLLTGSWVGARPWPEISAYSASKAGLAMLARSAARELAPPRIRVNVVAPGIVRAGLAKHQLETEPQYAARVATAVPLGELQTVEDVAGVVSFLCSPDAAYMTGSVVLTDGGCSLGPAQ
jgi:NAD(P)-dependent dehydrogenase (short-subunit alcohol dehydrogenase family)